MSTVRISPRRESGRSAAIRWMPAATLWVPVADVWETPSAYRIDLEVPAVAPDAVDVSVENGILTVSGEREGEDGDARAIHLERRRGRFSRRFRLPKNADPTSIEARIEQGVLALTIHKRPEHQPRRVEVVAA